MKKLLSIFILSIFLSACGTTQLISMRGNPDIYVNGEYKGKGRAEIKRMGFPKKITVTAKSNSEVIGEITTRRSFDIVTLIAGFYSLYTGFLWAWRFPETVMIPVDESKIEKETEEKDQRNIWMRPPGSGN